MASSDCQLFRSIAHCLTNQHFESYAEQFLQPEIRMMPERWKEKWPAVDNILEYKCSHFTITPLIINITILRICVKICVQKALTENSKSQSKYNKGR